MAFHVDHTAVNVDGDGCQFTFVKQLFEDFEIDISEHLSCFVAEITQKSRDRGDLGFSLVSFAV
jgi:hypothetical protein